MDANKKKDKKNESLNYKLLCVFAKYIIDKLTENRISF